MLQQLPVPPAVFVDREDTLAELHAVLDAAHEAGRPAYVGVNGPVGVGVRSLVRKCYRERLWQFTDGAIRVCLDQSPGSVFDALGVVLVELGVAGAELPDSTETRHNRLLTITYPMSVLLVIEGVTSPAQVEWFRLNAPRSAVIAVSRSRLGHLRNQDFRLLSVAPLDDRFGLELFNRILGDSWCSVPEVRPESVVRACGGYPLAITTTANQIANTPQWAVGDFLRNLALDGLNALDPDSQRYVRESFDRAYGQLDPRTAGVYRLVVGLHPGDQIPAGAARALAGTTDPDLAGLVNAHLMTQVGPDRFEVHDVARWHARDCVERWESREDQVTAVRRVLQWYLRAAVRHDRVLSDRPRIGPEYQRAATGSVSRESALNWLAEHRVALREAVSLAERYRLDDLAWQLCEAMWGVLHLGGHLDDWLITHRAGVAAALRTGQARAAMRMLSQLGSANLNAGNLDEAAECFAESGRQANVVGDTQGHQSALEWSGKVAAKRGDHDAALRLFAESEVVTASVAPEARPRTLALLALQRARVLLSLEQWAEAVAVIQPAVDHFAGTEETDNQAKTLLVLGQAMRHLNGSDAAIDLVRRSCLLFRADRSIRGELQALESLISWTSRPADEDVRRRAEIRVRLGLTTSVAG